MKFILQKNPTPTKKWRIITEDGTKVDFGLRGYSDYTIHKNPRRMRSYVRRHGGNIPMRTERLQDPEAIRKAMLRVRKSSREDWSDPTTAGFWSRWLLWSEPSISEAKRTIKDIFGYTIRQ